MLDITSQQIELTSEDISKWNILIALPCYDRQVTEPFFMSMLKTCMAFKEIGLKFGVSTISDSLISRARNQVVAKFMGNKDFTHILFIDVDLGFNPDDIIKMLWHDKDIMTGSYPIKSINWDKVAKLAKDGTKPSDLAKKSTRFVINPTLEVGVQQLKVDNGAISVYDAGTGFMLIKRSVFDKLFEAYPQLKYNDDTGTLTGSERNNSYALFNSYVGADGRFLSEDYGFCRYWQDIGGDVYTDPSIELMHLGRFEYQGSMMEWLIDNAAPVQ